MNQHYSLTSFPQAGVRLTGFKLSNSGPLPGWARAMQSGLSTLVTQPVRDNLIEMQNDRVHQAMVHQLRS